MLNESCRQAAYWNNECGKKIKVAVNVSVQEMMLCGFAESVFDVLQKHNLSSACLELEITESVVIADVDWIIETLNKLKSGGIKIALDDFGTGYSSLSQLQNLPIDTLKIDQSFICKLDGLQDSSLTVTATITSIAQRLGLETVAEGVETDVNLQEIKKLGIDIVQGYYYSKPVAAEELLGTIAQINDQSQQDRNAA